MWAITSRPGATITCWRVCKRIVRGLKGYTVEALAEPLELTNKPKLSNRPKAKSERIACPNRHVAFQISRALACVHAPACNGLAPAILFAEYAAPCRQTLSRMLPHPLGKLRCSHQAGRHRNFGEV